MEEQARRILRAALVEAPVPAKDLASRIRARFAGLGDVQLSLPEREPVRPPPSFAEGPKVVRAAAAKGRVRTKRRA